MSLALFHFATSRRAVVTPRTSHRRASSFPNASSCQGSPKVPTRPRPEAHRQHKACVPWRRVPVAPSRTPRCDAAPADKETTVTLERDAPQAKLNASKLCRLLTVNACVELSGCVAVLANPNAVFPEITKSVAGAECAQWYALALACLSLASFLCQRGVQSSDTNRLKNACLPTTASMFLYHVGVAWFQARQIFGTKASISHLPHSTD